MFHDGALDGGSQESSYNKYWVDGPGLNGQREANQRNFMSRRPVTHQMKSEFNLKLGSSREIFGPVPRDHSMPPPYLSGCVIWTSGDEMSQPGGPS